MEVTVIPPERRVSGVRAGIYFPGRVARSGAGTVDPDTRSRRFARLAPAG